MVVDCVCATSAEPDRLRAEWPRTPPNSPTAAHCHKTADDFRTALQAAGCYITDSAHDMLDWPAFQAADQETEIDLVVASIAHLGLREKAGHNNICARASELGLELCPAEVGPQLRLQYLDQPSPYWLKIVMEPMRPAGRSCRGADRDSNGFGSELDLIEREGGRIRQKEIGRHPGWPSKMRGNPLIVLYCVG